MEAKEKSKEAKSPNNNSTILQKQDHISKKAESPPKKTHKKRTNSHAPKEKEVIIPAELRQYVKMMKRAVEMSKHAKKQKKLKDEKETKIQLVLPPLDLPNSENNDTVQLIKHDGNKI